MCAQTPQFPQQAAQPDLVARPIELLSGATVCAGDSALFQASVVNGGSGPSDDFLVRWVADGGQPSDQLQAGLPPQGANKYQFTWSAVPLGTHQLSFLADGDGRIAEADETNNGTSVTFEAVECPG